MKMRCFLALIGTTALLTAFVACDDNDPIVDPPELNPADTPDRCMYHIERAFYNGDIDVLKKHVAPNFVFYFNPDDVGQVVHEYTIPESWIYDGFTTASRNMFKQTYSIGLSVQEIPAPPANATTYTARNIPIDMLLMVNTIEGYRVNKGYCDFAFEQYEDNGVKLWRLTKWWDHTSASLGDGVAPSSLGQILAMYR